MTSVTASGTNLTVRNLFRPSVFYFDAGCSGLNLFRTDLNTLGSSLNLLFQRGVSGITDVHTVVEHSSNIFGLESAFLALVVTNPSVNRAVFVDRTLFIDRAVFVDCVMRYSLVVGCPAMLVSRLARFWRRRACAGRAGTRVSTGRLACRTGIAGTGGRFTGRWLTGLRSTAVRTAVLAFVCRSCLRSRTARIAVVCFFFVVGCFACFFCLVFLLVGCFACFFCLVFLLVGCFRFLFLFRFFLLGIVFFVFRRYGCFCLCF